MKPLHIPVFGEKPVKPHTCTCPPNNPWRRLRDCPNEESIFVGATGFRSVGGKTQSQVSSESADASLEKYGRSNALPWMGKPGPVADPRSLVVGRKGRK